MGKTRKDSQAEKKERIKKSYLSFFLLFRY